MQTKIKSKDHQFSTLDQIPPKKKVIIKKIQLETPYMIRLMEMGIIPGETVEILQTAPLGDPIEISVMGYTLCIRKKEAALVEVEDAEND